MQTEPVKFNPVGVVGLGLLGRSIAASLLGSGFRVIACETQQQAQQVAHAYIENAISEMASHDSSLSATAGSWAGRYSISSSIHALKPCAFVIESVVEDLAAKHQVFEELEGVVGENVPIASNTSALPITSLQHGRRHPARILGMHWSEPAYGTRFLEIVRGEHTSDTALQAAMELGLEMGKEPCVVEQDIPGFIVNRLGYAMYREAAYLLELGIADVATIDRAFRNACGLWATLCGPFRWIDITGGPALYAKAMSGVLPTLNNSPEVPRVLAEKQRDGERGTINGRGFYTYEPGDAERWQKLFHEHAWEVKRLQDRYYPLTEERKKQ